MNPSPDAANPIPGSRHLVHVAAVIALCIMGDSLMYSLLPLEAEDLGIPLALVGLLLSANRIVRLASNSWAALLFERIGPRRPFIAAVLLTMATTLVYGLGWGFVAFLLARAGWGVAWSVFRQGGHQSVWGQPQERKGRLMGTLWGVVRLGSAVSVVLGGFIYDRFGYQDAVFTIALGAGLAVPLAVALRWPPLEIAETDEHSSALLHSWRQGFQTPPRRWIMIVGFMDTLFEGILTATLSLFLAARLGQGAQDLLSLIGTLAGLLLALRFIANLIFSPLFGALSDRFGQPGTLAALSLAIFLGVLGFVRTPGLVSLPLVALVFFAVSGLFTVGNAAVSGLARSARRPHQFVNLFNTTIDAGAAVGPLLAFSLTEITGFETLYSLSAFALLLASLRFWAVSRKEVRG